jgi:hypothetical protein
MSESKLPNMNEFSPGVGVDLAVLLRVVNDTPGDRAKQKVLIATSTAKIAATQDATQREARANNVLIGMSQCGLFDLDKSRLTGLGAELHALPTDDERHAAFAKHLLVNCHGDDLIDVVQMIRDRGETVTNQAIRDELRSRGFSVTENSGDASKIRMWLEKAGIADSNWTINDATLTGIIGVTSDALASWRARSRAERAFLEQLRRLDGDADDWISVRQVKALCEEQYGRAVFPEGRLRESVLDPLAQEGWIEAQGKGDGRGGDSGKVRATEKLLAVRLPVHVDGSTGIPQDLRKHLSRPLDGIFQDLQSNDTYVKGLALELLSLRLIRDVGLFPVAFRLRSVKTNGAEVDLVADGVHLHYSRWLFQCKNTRTVHVHDIAKEVGMAVVLKAQVIVLVTTGRFARTVVEYAKGLAESSALQAVLIDHEMLQRYESRGGSAVIDHLRDHARVVLRLKASQSSIVDENE